MASSSQDAHSQPKRPQVMARQSSTSSQVSQSPSDGHSSSHRAPHKVQRQHVVGGGRMQRNASFGKNLNKLSKHTQVHGGDTTSNAKHHRRSHSGSSTPLPSSPRPGVKRNASTVGIVRNTSHTHTQTALRKNHSSGHLPRQSSSSKNVLKATKSEIAPPKRSLAHPGKSPHHSPDAAHPTVHFDIGNEEGPEDGWTEESASQSPNTTRSNTRQNSVILDPHKPGPSSTMDHHEPEPSETEVNPSQYHTPPSPVNRYQPHRSYGSRQTNGTGSQHHSRPPDADMITSRLLQRNASHNLAPQTSTVSATVLSDTHDARTLSHSQGSTLVDSSGRDLVSRFMDGDESGGTPRDSNFLPSRDSPRGSGGDFDQAKRNKSAPNMADTVGSSNSRSHPRRSGTSTPTELPPSRTAQKLMLQRASSNIEPQKTIPVTLPRTGGPVYLQTSMMHSASSEGRIDPRLQQQFNHVALEYKVVRRYRNPLVDAVSRLEYTPGSPRKSRTPRSPMTNGFANMGHHDVAAEDGSGRRRSRVSFESRGSREEGDLEGRQSFESDNGRVRSEVEEICRRLWDSSEIAESP